MTAPLFLAQTADATELARLHAEAFPAEEAWSETVLTLQLAVPGAFGLVDPRGGMILARAIADESEIVTLAVAAAQRRQGIAAGLLRAAKDHAYRQGAMAMFLEVDVRNLPAQALYARSGFLPVGRRPHYYPNGSDALVLRADLENIICRAGATVE